MTAEACIELHSTVAQKQITLAHAGPPLAQAPPLYSYPNIVSDDAVPLLHQLLHNARVCRGAVLRLSKTSLYRNARQKWMRVL